MMVTVRACGGGLGRARSWFTNSLSAPAAVLALLLAGAVSAQSPTAIVLEPADMESTVSAAAGESVRLAVRKRTGEQPMAGEAVEWSVTGPEGGRLSAPRSLTSAATEAGPGGVAEVSFGADIDGAYRVVASSQVNPGCSGEGCARFVTTEFAVEVSPVATTTDSGSGSGRGLLIGAAAAVGAAALLSSNDSDRSPPEPTRSLAIVSGDGQFGLQGRPLAAPLVVNARDNGLNAPGIQINWTASAGTTLSGSTSATDAAGLASISITSMGPAPGPVTVTASRADQPSTSVTFSLGVNVPGFNKVSGDGQTASTLTLVANPLVVEALVNGAPQAGVTVQWTVLSGSATVDSVANGGVSNAQGRSSASIRFGSTPGPVVVQARRADTLQAVSFNLTAAQTRSLTVQAGDGQSGAQNTALAQALVVQARNNGIADAGLGILWSTTGDITLSSSGSNTDAGGLASVTVTSLGRDIGPQTVTATRSDDPSVRVQFDIDVLPPSLGGVGGNNQSGMIGSVANQPLSIQLLDADGHPMAGETITWRVTSGSASVSPGTSITNAAGGNASTTLTFGATPGPIVVTASAFNGDVEFEFDATAVTADALTKVSGDGQTAAPGATLAPFVVRIQPPAGVTAIGGPSKPRALDGVPIRFTLVSGKGTLSHATVLTDVNGEASSTLTLSLTPGVVSVLAAVQNGPSATFTATATGTLVSSVLSIVSGDGQTLVPGPDPSLPMVVELKGNGSPIVGQTITWTTTAGTVLSPTTVTDANGRASTTVRIASPANVQVTANFAGFAAFEPASVTFNHSSTLAALPQLDSNEASVAAALDNACAALQSGSDGGGGLTPAEQDLLTQCLALTAGAEDDSDNVAEAIEEMLPDVAETQSQSSQAAATAQFDNLKGRITALRSGSIGASFSGLALNTAGGAVPLFGLGTALLGEAAAGPEAGADFGRWGLFVSGNIGRGESDAQGLAPRFDFDVNGLTVGVDYRQSDQVVLGLALGYTSQDTELAAGQGGVDMSGFSLSGYGTWYRDDSWYLDGVLTYASNDYDHRRRVAYALALPGGGSVIVDQQARASAGGTDFSASLTFGRDFNQGGWTYGFYGRANYSRLGFDAFEEQLEDGSSGSGLGLRVESRSVTGFSTVLGGKASYAHSASWGVLMPSLEFEWQNEHQSDPEAFRAFFINDPSGTPILVVGDPLDDSYFRLSLGLAMVLTEGRSGFLRYERLVARDGISQDSLSLGFRMEF